MAGRNKQRWPETRFRSLVAPPEEDIEASVSADIATPARGIVASAIAYKGNSAPRIYGGQRGWQREAYRHYTICGEARYAARYYGNALSRCTLQMVEPDGKNGTNDVVTTGVGYDALMSMVGGTEGMPGTLDAIGVHLTIGGECYLIGRRPPGQTELDGGTAYELQPDQKLWEIYSPLEVQVAGKKWTIKREGMAPIPLADDDDVIRIWRPDPASRLQPDSPFKSLLPILSEIEYLTKHVFSQIRSRLVSAGIMVVPNNLSFPKAPAIDGVESELSEADQFMESLGEAMMTALEDQGHPSAVVPYVLQGEGEHIEKIKLLKFWSDLDENAMPLRQEAIHRFALGMDLPPEQVEGMGSNPGTGGGTSNGVSHWGAWQIEESTIKIHIEPMLDLIASAITTSYLRPVIGIPPTQRVGYSTTALRLRPDRSKEAITLNQMLLLSDEATVLENGFDTSQMPTDEQLKTMVLRKIASGSATPEQVAIAAKLLADIDLGAPSEQGTNGREARPTPSLEPLPTRDLPERAAKADLLIAGCYPLILRALEKAGNRLRRDGVRPDGVPAYLTHCYATDSDPSALLEGAFESVADALDGLPGAQTALPAIQAYAALLIRRGEAPTRDGLAEALSLTRKVAV